MLILDLWKSCSFVPQQLRVENVSLGVYGKNLSFKLFIHQLIGLNRNTAKQAFAEYLEGSTFNANQICFLATIIDYLNQNGVFEADDADQIISIVRSFNETIGKEFGVA